MSNSHVPETFVEQVEYEKGFAPYFQEHIAPLLENLERDRKRKFAWFVAVCLVFIATFAVFALVQSHSDHLDTGVFFIFILLIVPALVWPLTILFSYSHEAKSVLMPPLVKFFGDFHYSPAGLGEAELISFSIMPPHDEFRSRDHVQGSWAGVEFELSQITLVKRCGSRRLATFQGLALRLRIKEPFRGQTLLKGRIPFWKYVSVADPTPSLEAVGLEDVGFSEQFEAWSTDPVEARGLLRPAFLECLREFTTLLNHWGANPSHLRHGHAGSAWAAGLRCGFQGDGLLLLVPSAKNLFAPGNLFAPAYHLHAIRCVLCQIDLVRRMVRTLKLNEGRQPQAGESANSALPPPIPSHPHNQP